MTAVYKFTSFTSCCPVPLAELARATEQHNGLKHALAQQCHKVSLHIILVGLMGTIYKCHTELPLCKLGLDRCRVRKLTLDLNTHSIQYATKIINTSRRLKNIKERTYGSSLSISFSLIYAGSGFTAYVVFLLFVGRSSMGVRRVLKRAICSFLDVFQPGPPTCIYDVCCILNRMSVQIKIKFSYSTPV